MAWLFKEGAIGAAFAWQAEPLRPSVRQLAMKATAQLPQCFTQLLLSSQASSCEVCRHSKSPEFTRFLHVPSGSDILWRLVCLMVGDLSSSLC